MRLCDRGAAGPSQQLVRWRVLGRSLVRCSGLAEHEMRTPMIASAGGRLESLSAQDLLSCSTTDGCDGGYPYEAISWAATHGIDTDASYPYTSAKGDAGTCESSRGAKAPIKVKSYSAVPSPL